MLCGRSLIEFPLLFKKIARLWGGADFPAPHACYFASANENFLLWGQLIMLLVMVMCLIFISLKIYAFEFNLRVQSWRFSFISNIFCKRFIVKNISVSIVFPWFPIDDLFLRKTVLATVIAVEVRKPGADCWRIGTAAITGRAWNQRGFQSPD